MIGTARPFRREERGQSLVEFALTLPLVLLLLCGIFEMGWVGGNALIVQNATREGVRSGIVATNSGQNDSQVEARIRAMSPENISSTMRIDITYSDANDFRAGDITVVVYYELPAITPLAGMLTPNGVFSMTASCTMKMS